MRGHFFKRLLRDTRGATAVEYGLIVSLVIIAILVALAGVADQNTALWGFVSGTIETSISAS